VKRAGLGCLLLLLSACASGPPPPEWIDGSSTRYPDERFVVGVASGPSAERAAALALESTFDQTGESEGARVVETWVDTKTKTHWAMAVLERGPLIDRLLAELAQIDAQLAAALAAADSDPPNETLSVLAGAIARLDERERLRERIINLNGAFPAEDAEASERAAALEAKLAEIKRSLRIEISSYEMDSKTGETSDPLDENRRSLSQKVIALGFAVGQAEVAWGEDPVWLRVESRVGIERLQLHPNDTMVAVHWDAAIEITDVAAGGETVAVLTDQGRATHLNEREASRQADADAMAFAAAALEAWLNARTQSPNPTP
jgi:hypothetical protein